MELTDLQQMWTQHNKDVNENTRINKLLLRNLLISKTSRKLNWIKVKTIFNMVLPIVLVATILIPRIEMRNELNFIIGSLLFGIVFIIGYIWNIQYFLKISKIDLTNEVTKTKKDIMEFEKYKFKTTKLSYMIIPIALIGMFMMMEFPFFAKSSLVPISLIIFVMLSSIYITFRFSIFEWFRKINNEIVEIEKLEIE